jgi:hypothetical protein
MICVCVDALLYIDDMVKGFKKGWNSSVNNVVKK